jgi:hypothetical protein
MAETFVDIALVEVDGREMRTIKSLSVTPQRPKSPVNTMNRLGVAIGVTQGIASFGVKITAAIQAANPEIDWHDWALNKKAKLVSYEMNDGGRRVSLIDVFINSVDEKYDENGEAVYDIDGFALRRKED